MKNKLVFLIIPLFFSCCARNDEISNHIVEIDINQNVNKNLPELEILDIVPLETNDSSIFGDISAIEYYSGKIYMLDIFNTKSVLVFNKEGDFINKTELGKGPEEIINPFAFCVDKKNKHILVWDQTLKEMFTFDLNLNFVSRKSVPQLVVLEFAKLANDAILVRSHFNQDSAFTLYSPNLTSVRNQYIKDFKYDGVEGLSRSISSYERTFLISSFNYNIYELTESGVHCEFFFDFGTYQITEEDVKENGLQGTWKLINTGEKVSGPHEIDASKNYLLFHVFYKNKKIFYLKSLDKDLIYRLNDYFVSNELPNCEIRGVIDNDTFYGVVKPNDLIEFQNNTARILFEKDLNPQQNPLIISFSIK